MFSSCSCRTKHVRKEYWGGARTPVDERIKSMAAQLKVIGSGLQNSGMDRQKALEAALAQIDRAFGKGSAMKLGSREKIEIETIPTGSLGLDIALGVGGLPRGRVVEIYGPESSGKTTLALGVGGLPRGR